MKKKKIKPIDIDKTIIMFAHGTESALVVISVDLMKKVNEVISYLNDEGKTAGTTVPKKEKKQRKEVL